MWVFAVLFAEIWMWPLSWDYCNDPNIIFIFSNEKTYFSRHMLALCGVN